VYCSLFHRPLPFSNTTAANFPTIVNSEELNTALTEIWGYDLEVGYRHAAPGGSLSGRLLANFQPVTKSQAYPGAPVLYSAVATPNSAILVTAPKGRFTAFLSYDLADTSFNLEDHWLSSYSQVQTAGQYWASPRVSPFNTVDFSVERRFTFRGLETSAYLSVENVFNVQPPLVAWPGSVGITYPAPYGDDILGRYFTLGFRMNVK
jgi:hypothetical protein